MIERVALWFSAIWNKLYAMQSYTNTPLSINSNLFIFLLLLMLKIFSKIFYTTLMIRILRKVWEIEKILDKILNKIYIIISKVYKKKFQKICCNFESDLGNWKKFLKFWVRLQKYYFKFVEINILKIIIVNNMKQFLYKWKKFIMPSKVEEKFVQILSKIYQNFIQNFKYFSPNLLIWKNWKAKWPGDSVDRCSYLKPGTRLSTRT